MEAVIQYIIIAVIFLVAVGYVVKRFLPAKSKNGGCGKGCGCAMTEPAITKDNADKR